MNPSIRMFILAATVLFAVIPCAFAQDDAVALEVGTARRLFLEKSFQTVIISNPLVVDVRTDDERSVLVEPLGPGEANLVFIDAHGMVTANIKVSVCGVPSSGACATRNFSR